MPFVLMFRCYLQDFWGVYHDKVGFLHTVDERDIYVRTSVADRTFQVASGFLFGMDLATVHKSWPVFTEPSVVRAFISTRIPRPSLAQLRPASVFPD